MPRPRKCRRVCEMPGTTVFLPEYNQHTVQSVTLTVDEYEAVRLIDYEGLSQEQCGDQMKVARTTVQAIYMSARRKIAEALVEGYALVIGGGDYRLCEGMDSGCIRKRCIRQTENDHSMARSAGRKGGKTMRIAVTYENGQIFQHFGHTEAFKVYDVEEGKVVASEVLNTNGSGHGALAGMLAQLKVDVLICGGIGGGAQMALAQAGIRLFGGVKGSADEAVEALLRNELNYDPEARCDHHGEHHHSEHNCGGHHQGNCGEHGCHGH